MTKEILFKSLILGAAFSVLIACNSAPEIGTNATNVAGGSGNTASAKKSDYPPLAAKAAQADMRHLDGSTSKIADLKGKVLLLNMWATWCGPCREEMPELVKLQDEYRDQGFEVIGLNTDDGDTTEMVEKFAAEMNLNYTLVWADTEMQQALVNISKFQGIPQSFLVDRDGNLRGVFKGASKSEIAKMKTSVAKVISGEDTGAVLTPAEAGNAADASVPMPTAADVSSETKK